MGHCPCVVHQRPCMKSETIFIPLILFVVLQSCAARTEKIHPARENITESVYASGMIKADNQYKVFPTVNGRVAEILVKEGDQVKKGDVIIRLENTNARLSTENAAIAAGYASAKANQERLRDLQIEINLAQAKMVQDALLQQRQQHLWDEKIGTRNELEQRQLAYKTSVTAYNSAKLKYAQLQKEINFQERQSQKNLELSTAVRNDYNIKSEMNGKVYTIIPEKGEMATTQSPVAVIGDASAFTIEVQVDEYDISRIKAGQKMFLSMDSYRGQSFEAVVTRIDPIMNEKSKSFKVEGVFVKPPVVLYPNLTCEANILISRKENAITIPRTYLLPGDSVLLGKGVKRKVVTGLKDYQKVEIVSGLSVTDLIYNPAL